MADGGNAAVRVTSLSPPDAPNIDTARINTDAHMPPRHRITLMQIAFLSAASIFRIGASEQDDQCLENRSISSISVT